ncbi:uncharacterized protein LOC132563259 [Ylistrum balloti]|uniref:uncharacterized protein LOC132563259 n=1 Tax=Ylistrum balloti TaxID=509963 RepID=UPI002905A908|nr:uncharacterized protein LOC132563259 [Ylistrum balloti]
MALDMFSLAEFEKHLTANEFGKKLIYKDMTETTMDDALNAAYEGTPNGTAIMAEQQSKARGMKNRKWNAQNTGNIYISYVYHRVAVLEDPRRDECLMEVSAALAVYTALHDIGVEGINIKWLNDIWVRGHKMAGILVEDKGPLPTDQSKRLCIVGIGVNVNADVRRHPELHKISTSARSQLKGNIVNREEFLAKMSKYLEDFLPLTKEDLFQRAIKYQLFQLGDPVKIHSELNQKVTDGTLEEFMDNWSIKLKDDSGKVWTAIADHYSIRPCSTSTVYVYNGKMACPWSSEALLRGMSSLVNTTHTTITLLNDTKMKEGHWKKDAALLAIGEISLTTEDISSAHQVFTDILSFIENGGVVMMMGNVSGLFSTYLQSKSSTETTCNLQSTAGTSADNFQSGRIVTLDLKCGDLNQMFGYCNSKEDVTFQEKTGQSSEVLACYGNHEPAVVVSTYGKGSCILLGFNVEITYVDESIHLSDAELSNLRDTVFVRDELLLNILKRFGL